MLVFILQLKLTEKEFEFRVSSLFVINQTERNSFDQNQKRPTRKSVVFLIIFIRVFFFDLHASPRNCKDLWHCSHLSV